MLIGFALFGWFLDKAVSDNRLVAFSGDKVTEIKNRFNPTELGYNSTFSSRYPWKRDKNHTIGDIDPSNPKPFIDMVPLKRKLAVSDGRQKYVVDDVKSSAYKLVHERENLEEYHKFDPDYGHNYPKMVPYRKSKIASLYD